MKTKSKILININNLEEIKKYEEIGITNFLFAVKDLSIGYSSFDLDEIPDNCYLLLNRMLDSKDTKWIKEHMEDFNRFKGILFEDLAILNMFSKTSLELIIYQNHFETNHETINFFLDNDVSSAVISSEITDSEILSIINKSNKPLVLTVFAKNQIMYSRRYLLTNFGKNFDIVKRDNALLKENVSDSRFLMKETDYGTVLFNDEYFNYIEFANTIDEEKIKFFMVINLDLSCEEIISILDGKKIGNEGFLHTKTVVNKADYK